MEKNLDQSNSSNRNLPSLNENLKQLEILEQLAETGSLKDKEEYLKFLLRMNVNHEIDDERCKEILSTKKEYCNKLREYYEEKLEEFKVNSDESVFIDDIIYRLSKLSFYNLIQEPTFSNKKKFAKLIKNLTDKNYGKAYLLRYKAGGRTKSQCLDKSKEFKDRKFIKFHFE